MWRTELRGHVLHFAVASVFSSSSSLLKTVNVQAGELITLQTPIHAVYEMTNTAQMTSVQAECRHQGVCFSWITRFLRPLSTTDFQFMKSLQSAYHGLLYVTHLDAYIHSVLYMYTKSVLFFIVKQNKLQFGNLLMLEHGVGLYKCKYDYFKKYAIASCVLHGFVTHLVRHLSRAHAASFSISTCTSALCSC